MAGNPKRRAAEDAFIREQRLEELMGRGMSREESEAAYAVERADAPKEWYVPGASALAGSIKTKVSELRDCSPDEFDAKFRLATQALTVRSLQMLIEMQESPKTMPRQRKEICTYFVALSGNGVRAVSSAKGNGGRGAGAGAGGLTVADMAHFRKVGEEQLKEGEFEKVEK